MDDPKVFDVIQLLGRKTTRCSSLRDVIVACNNNNNSNDSDIVDERSAGEDDIDDETENDVCLRVAVQHEEKRWKQKVEQKKLV